MAPSNSNGPSHLPLASSLPKVSFRRIPAEEAEALKMPVGVHSQQIIDFGFNDGREYVKPDTYLRYIEPVEAELNRHVEYDMDEQDQAWLDALNAERTKAGEDRVSYEAFEIIIDRFEKEWFDLMKKVPPKPLPVDEEGGAVEEDTHCAICDDGECENSNAIVFCDGCNLAVHQDCYGIPYIPEGQWLCRKCTVSPDRAVSCLFCPHEGGAFKQTTQGKWAHLLCAMWIPETGVANAVYMEPIDSVERIPKARWRLQCYLCRKKVGACIQCENRNCFTAFHVTCARQAGLLVRARRKRVEGGSGAEGSGGEDDFEEETVEALHASCHRHIDPDAEVLGGGTPAHGILANGAAALDDRDLSRSSTPLIHLDDSSSSKKSKRKSAGGSSITVKRGKGGQLTLSVKKKKKISKSARAYKKSYRVGPPLVPAFIINRVSEYIRNLMIRKKSALVIQIAKFWSLKREARRGAPLLKRLHLEPWTANSARARGAAGNKGEEMEKKLIFLSRLRQDLENLRALTELVRKREREKQRIVKLFRSSLVAGVLKPYHAELRAALEKIAALDYRNHFLHPVNKALVTDYYDIVKEPMDWTTIAGKCDNFEYTSVAQFEHDIMLVANNSMLYNKPDTSYHKIALKVKNGAVPVLAELKRKLAVHRLEDYGIGPDATLSDEKRAELLAHLQALELEPEQCIVELLDNYGDDELLETIADDEDPATAPSNVVENLVRLYHRPEREPTPEPTRAQIKAEKAAARSEASRKAAASRKERKAAAEEARKAGLLPPPRRSKREADAPPATAAEDAPSASKRARRSVGAASAEPEISGKASASDRKPPKAPSAPRPKRPVGWEEVLVPEGEEPQTVAPKTLEVEQVGDWDSFKRFNVGWVLPEGSKRGGRAPAPKPAAPAASSSSAKPRAPKKPKVEPEHAAAEASSSRTKAPAEEESSGLSELDDEADGTESAPSGQRPSASAAKSSPKTPKARSPTQPRSARGQFQRKVASPAASPSRAPSAGPSAAAERSSAKATPADDAASTSSLSSMTDDEDEEEDEETESDSESEDQTVIASPPASKSARTAGGGAAARAERLRAMREAQAAKDEQRAAKAREDAIALSEVRHRKPGAARRAGKEAVGRVPASKELEPGTLVWAQTANYPYFPSTIYAEKHKDVPPGVRAERPADIAASELALVRFFDGRRSWAWVPRDRVRLMLEDEAVDDAMLFPADKRQRAAVRKGFARAKEERA